ncbi:MAG TPA: hypothetical protein VI072_16940 [Polyangiaceae bacterium]
MTNNQYNPDRLISREASFDVGLVLLKNAAMCRSPPRPYTSL